MARNTVSRLRLALSALCLFGTDVALGNNSPPVAKKRIGGRAVAPQQFKITINGGAQAPNGSTPALVLPESSDLNRVLRKVTEFFAQEPPKWDDGVRMLQDLLEGKLLSDDALDRVNDPFYSVFSEDNRLYVPFASYCQRLVCQLPPEGLEAYRFLTDGPAREAFDRAARDLDFDVLQRLAEIYFATSVGPEAVALLADLCALRGELARAAHLREWLLAEFPDLDEEKACQLRVRQAHTFALLGDGPARDATLDRLSPERAVEVVGMRVMARKLSDHPAFTPRDTRGVAVVSENPGTANGFSKLDVLRLWEVPFTKPDPYGIKPVKGENARDTRFFFGRRTGAWVMPHKQSFRPGMSVTPLFLDERCCLAFKDHDRLMVLDLLSGKTVARFGKASATSFSTSRSSLLRQRLPATDFGLQRVAAVDSLLFCTVDNKAAVQSNKDDVFPFRNRLAALDPVTGREVWRTPKAPKGQRLFFQSPPLAYRSWLYAPVRQKRSFLIARIERATGKVVSTVTIHGGGTTFLRVPAVPPVRVGNTLIQLTNAGAIAAFSLPHLELRWLRRYEKRTRHQKRPRPSASRRQGFGYAGLQAKALRQWKPSTPIVSQGRVIIAPTDSDALGCFDVHTGNIVWMLPRKEKRGGVNFQEVVGHDGVRLYLAGTHLQCVDIAGGKRIWEVPLSHLPRGKPVGHGMVAGGHVHLPFPGGFYRLDCRDGREAGIAEFPTSTRNEINWGVPVRLQMAGSVLLAVTEAGVVAYTVADDLFANSDGGLQRAQALAATGQLGDAWNGLATLLDQGAIAGSRVDPKIAAMFVRFTGEFSANRGKDGVDVIERAQAVLQRLSLEDPRLLLFRIKCLDATKDAKEIRTLRERIADLTLEQLGLDNETTRKGAFPERNDGR